MVETELICSDVGVWSYDGNTVTEAECSIVFPACSSCDVDSISLVAGDNVNSITPTLSTPTDSGGCSTVTATCDASDVEGAKTIMTVSLFLK